MESFHSCFNDNREPQRPQREGTHSIPTVVLDAQRHAQSAPLLTQGDETCLGDLPDDGRQVLFVPRGGGLGVAAVAARSHGLALGDGGMNGRGKS